MISADADFPRLHQEWQASGRQHAGIIYVHPQRKDDIGALVEFLDFLHQAVEDTDLETEVYNQLKFL